jgi:predicted CXXCH cytochrome family protein
MDPMELCFSCHIITKEELTEFEHVHEPAKGNCFGCHDPHGADNRDMLKAQAPELCYPCHEDIKKLAEESKHKHNVVGEPGGCLKCHTPHASTVPSGLKQVPMNLCISCHDKPVGLDKDDVMKPFTDEVANKKFMHGPVGQKDCKGCHITHGSNHFRLLMKEYPPQFYSPFKKSNYDLCFSCHEETLVQTAETASLTDFRNGSSNLHYLHVNKERRGRTCRSCHATHASSLPKHIRETVPYGVWDLPIQFTKTETGGSCKPGCHVPYAYDRNHAVEYKKP